MSSCEETRCDKDNDLLIVKLIVTVSSLCNVPRAWACEATDIDIKKEAIS